MLLENPIYTNLKTFFVLSCGFLVLAERLFREPQIAITNSLSNASGGLAIGIVAGTIYNVTEKYSPLILCVAAGLYATSRKNFSRAGE